MINNELNTAGTRAIGPRCRGADWQPLLDVLGRGQAAAGVTDDTTLRESSELLWREHARQDCGGGTH